MHHDSVSGAGNVVTKDLPPGGLAAGVPSRMIREITELDSWNELWNDSKNGQE
ncbi:hypothetical protein BRLA_c030000 [Brevibacillus laterosporus LMG 15441]|uniref:Uncharacterized protein n=1 Tax=Brevibacillus laterosporus LMG 15441 TaxID=1042163 RepID=A0A075R459_BRELA|nr:hypothetical protein BRLA_c030000 [Brevibacillus laterosporus LMG 15441]